MPWLYALAVLVFGLPLQASELRLEGQLIQGGVVRGQVAPGSAVWLDGQALRVSPDGWFVFGFGRDAAERAELVVRPPEGRAEPRALEVAKRSYRVERVERAGAARGDAAQGGSRPDRGRCPADRGGAAARQRRPRLHRESGVAGGRTNLGRLWQSAHPERRAARPASRARHRGAAGHAGWRHGERRRLARQARHVLHRRHRDGRPWPRLAQHLCPSAATCWSRPGRMSRKAPFSARSVRPAAPPGRICIGASIGSGRPWIRRSWSGPCHNRLVKPSL